MGQKTTGNEPLRPGDVVSYYGGDVRLLLRTTKAINGTDCGLLRREDCWWFDALGIRGGFYAPLSHLCDLCGQEYHCPLVTHCRRADTEGDAELHGGEVRR